MAWLLWHRYWNKDWARLPQFFGLLNPRTQIRPLIGAALALFAIAWIALTWVPVAVEAVGFQSHWAEGIVESELFGSWPARLFPLLDGIVWAPLLEEILFRGLLFATLRRRLRLLPAAALSALAFSAIHCYSPPGFLGVAAFGFVTAVAYEQTRSLVPCIVAHMITNLLLIGGPAWVYSW
jgi:membrane protease YdiL (CAAX protease family)